LTYGKGTNVTRAQILWHVWEEYSRKSSFDNVKNFE